MSASSTLPPGSPSASPNAGRRLRRCALIGGVVAAAAAGLVGSVLVQPAARYARAPTPTGPGSVSGAPNLPPGFTKTFTALGFRRFRLFLTALLYEEPGGRLRRATAVASRDGDLVAYDAGEVVEHAGRVPASRLFDDDLTGRSPRTLVDALADRDQAFFAHEVAGWTRGRRSVDEVGIELLHHWFRPQRSAPPAITGSEVLGVVPLEVTDALLDELHRLADRHQRGSMVERVMELPATSDPGRFTMSGATERS
jgi:hypothetical protein